MIEKIFLRKLKYSKLLKLDILDKFNTIKSNIEVMNYVNSNINKDLLKELKKELRLLKIKYLSNDKE